MGLLLKLSDPVQSADLTTITFTDNTGIYMLAVNDGGWGTPNSALADINGSTSHLTLQITLTEPSGVVTTFDTIDFYTIHGGQPISISDLVFPITSALLFVSGVAYGDGLSALPDGWYDVVYAIDHDEIGGTGSPTSTDMSIISDGIVRKANYDANMRLPDRYSSVIDLPTADEQKLIDVVKYGRALLDGKSNYPVPANKQRILNALAKLQTLNYNL